MAIPQQKALASGQTVSWELDIEAMARTARWATRQPELLRSEVERVIDAFPTFVAAVGVPLGEDRCWVEAAEPLLCARCRDLIVFDGGTRCVACRQDVSAPAGSAVGFVGRIPALIAGRPFEGSFQRRLQTMQSTGSALAAPMARSVIEAGGKRYLAPRFAIWFSRSWPHADPPVMVWPEYFPVLDIAPDHVYHADEYYRLCLYATWRERPACDVMRNRVVPRLLIDLMVADLQAIGRLDAALDRLDTSLYDLYNAAGHPKDAAPFQRVYEELVRAET